MVTKRLLGENAALGTATACHILEQSRLGHWGWHLVRHTKRRISRVFIIINIQRVGFFYLNGQANTPYYLSISMGTSFISKVPILHFVTS